MQKVIREMIGIFTKTLLVLVLALPAEVAYSQNLASDSIAATIIKSDEKDDTGAAVSAVQDSVIKKYTQIKKTKSGACVRSLVLPGWGQHYAGNKRMGKVYLAAASAASCFAIYAVYKHQHNIHELNESIDAYNDADDLEETIAAYDIVEDKYDKAQSSNVLSRISVLTLSMVWGLNIIDALLFFPDDVDLKMGMDDMKGDRLKARVIITYNI